MANGGTEQRKLAAIMFTDMAGYSALAQRNEALALQLLEEHRRLLRGLFPKHQGTEIKTTGDGFLVEFASALAAVRCAIEIQRSLATRNVASPTDRQLQVRIGIHVGDVVHHEGDVLGDGVNIASRIELLASPGGICISMDVERQIRNAIETSLVKLGPTELKNIQLPMELFRVVLPWEQEKPPGVERKAAARPWSLALIASLVAALVLAGIYFGTRLASVPEAQGRVAGEMVRVEYNNGWWPATVLEVKESFGVNAYHIKYTQSGLMEWVAPNRIVSAVVTGNPPPVGLATDTASPQAGQGVQVEYNGQWYPATLLEMKDAYGVNAHHIKYTQNGLEEWVAPNRIKSQ